MGWQCGDLSYSIHMVLNLQAWQTWGRRRWGSVRTELPRGVCIEAWPSRHYPCLHPISAWTLTVKPPSNRHEPAQRKTSSPRETNPSVCALSLSGVFFPLKEVITHFCQRLKVWLNWENPLRKIFLNLNLDRALRRLGGRGMGQNSVEEKIN